MDGIDGGLLDGGMLDAMGQLQELSAGDPIPVMRAKKNPLHRVWWLAILEATWIM